MIIEIAKKANSREIEQAFDTYIHLREVRIPEMRNVRRWYVIVCGERAVDSKANEIASIKVRKFKIPACISGSSNFESKLREINN